jgi:copper resistance protein D
LRQSFVSKRGRRSARKLAERPKAIGGSLKAIIDPACVPVPLLTGLRRVTEAGIGFSILLAAASLTSQPLAVDLVAGRLTAHEIVGRFRPIVPRFSTPPLTALSAATPLDVAVNSFDNSAVAQSHNQDPDIAWSEYSHHWAGVIVLCLGFGALLSRRFA